MVYSLLVGVICMKNNLIRNTLLLLLIPLAITVIIVVTNRRDYGFSATVKNDGTAYVEKYNTSRTGSREGDFVEDFNQNYTFMMFTAIVMVIIFIIFYAFLTRKKEW